MTSNSQMPGCIAPTLHSPLLLDCAELARAREGACRISVEGFEPNLGLIDWLAAFGDDAAFDAEGRVLGVDNGGGGKGRKGRKGRKR